MNSVDTGWINDENPLERATKTAKTNLFQQMIKRFQIKLLYQGINIFMGHRIEL